MLDAVVIGAAGLVLAVIVYAIVMVVRLPGLRARRQAMKQRELAVIVESVRFTFMGWISLALLILSTGVWILIARGVTAVVLAPLIVGAGWCGSVVMFGLGVALGRRRTLTVYRPESGE